jgi:hypothetical protein
MTVACDRFIKDVSDKRIITGDFSEWLDDANLDSVSWTVPSGISSANDSFGAKTATNYFSGGSDNEEYTIKCTITTDESVARVKSHSFILAVESNCGC